MVNITAWVSGLIFGLGLILAGMANPGKVLAFLDVAGAWDPSLALVMAGAIAVGSVAFAMADKRGRSYLGLPMNLPASRVIDKRLVLGSLAFGMGWGLAGICPGPALVLLGSGSVKGMVFVAAMLLGMGIFEILERRRFTDFFRIRKLHNDIASAVSGSPPSHGQTGYVKK
ncbi:MAG: YeeE/YedE family protein [Nitrosospira sp.]